MNELGIGLIDSKENEMLIKLTTIGGSVLFNTDLIDAVTEPFEKEEPRGSLLWCSKKGLPDCGYAMDDDLVG